MTLFQMLLLLGMWDDDDDEEDDDMVICAPKIKKCCNMIDYSKYDTLQGMSAEEMKAAGIF